MARAKWGAQVACQCSQPPSTWHQSPLSSARFSWRRLWLNWRRGEDLARRGFSTSPVTMGHRRGEVAAGSVHCGTRLSNGGSLCIATFLERVFWGFFSPLCEFESRCSARLINSLSALGCPTITVWGSFLLQKNHIGTVSAGFWRALCHYFCCCLKVARKKGIFIASTPQQP